MKKSFALFLALSLSAVFMKAFGFPLDDDPEACWQKSVQAALLSKDYVPGRIYLKFERLDNDGKVKEQNETWLELLPGEKEAKLVKALKDGKDVTREALAEERERKEESREKGKKNDGDNFINLSSEEIVPFLTNAQQPVVHTYLGKEKENGVDCRVFAFRKEYVQKKGAKKKTVTQHGKIWLDAVSGMPVKSFFSSVPLPAMVKEMEMAATFIQDGDRFFVKGYQMRIKAGFLFFNKRLRMIFDLGGYRKSDQENQ